MMLCKNCRKYPRYLAFAICYPCYKNKYILTKICPECGINKIESSSNSCRQCYYKLRILAAYNSRPDRTCQWCKKSYKPQRIKTGLFFCSRECYFEFLKVKIGKGAENAPAWKGRPTRQRSGYIYIYDDKRKERVRIHTQIAEEVLGRRLRKGEIVHHINLNKEDYRNKNLLICTQSYHRWLHYQMELAWVREHLR